MAAERDYELGLAAARLVQARQQRFHLERKMMSYDFEDDPASGMISYDDGVHCSNLCLQYAGAVENERQAEATYAAELASYGREVDA